MRRREYIAPNTWNSWTCVDTVCSDSNARRKQMSSDRKLLGANQCKQLQQAAAPLRQAPTADDLRMPALYGESSKTRKRKSNDLLCPAPHEAAASSVSGSLSLASSASDANELSPTELRQVAQGCLQF